MFSFRWNRTSGCRQVKRQWLEFKVVSNIVMRAHTYQKSGGYIGKAINTDILQHTSLI